MKRQIYTAVEISCNNFLISTAEQPPDWLVYYDVIFDPGEKSRVRLCRKWQQNETGARRLNVNISGMDEWYVLKFGG